MDDDYRVERLDNETRTQNRTRNKSREELISRAAMLSTTTTRQAHSELLNGKYLESYFAHKLLSPAVFIIKLTTTMIMAVVTHSLNPTATLAPHTTAQLPMDRATEEQVFTTNNNNSNHNNTSGSKSHCIER